MIREARGASRSSLGIGGGRLLVVDDAGHVGFNRGFLFFRRDFLLVAKRSAACGGSGSGPDGQRACFDVVTPDGRGRTGDDSGRGTTVWTNDRATALRSTGPLARIGRATNTEDRHRRPFEPRIIPVVASSVKLAEVHDTAGSRSPAFKKNELCRRRRTAGFLAAAKRQLSTVGRGAHVGPAYASDQPPRRPETESRDSGWVFFFFSRRRRTRGATGGTRGEDGLFVRGPIAGPGPPGDIGARNLAVRARGVAPYREDPREGRGTRCISSTCPFIQF